MIAALLAAALLVLWRALAPASISPMPRGIPIEKIAGGRPAPQIGLVVSLPTSIPLPQKGRVIGAGLYPPQPPGVQRPL